MFECWFEVVEKRENDHYLLDWSHLMMGFLDPAIYHSRPIPDDRDSVDYV